MSQKSYECFKVDFVENEAIAIVTLHRPKAFNAMNNRFWLECSQIFRQHLNPSKTRCVIINAEGKHFSSGLDLNDPPALMAGAFSSKKNDIGRTANIIKRDLMKILQEAFNAIEEYPFPVISAIHGACLGGATNMVAACDIRIATEDSFFSVKEIDLGLAADLGALQRIPKIVGHSSWFREICYSGRNFSAKEAHQKGFISKICTDKDQLNVAAMELAQSISQKSPIALMGTKVNLNYSRDHSVQEGLDYIATWNSSMLQSNDVVESVKGALQKKRITFANL